MSYPTANYETLLEALLSGQAPSASPAPANSAALLEILDSQSLFKILAKAHPAMLHAFAAGALPIAAAKPESGRVCLELLHGLLRALGASARSISDLQCSQLLEAFISAAKPRLRPKTLCALWSSACASSRADNELCAQTLCRACDNPPQSWYAQACARSRFAEARAALRRMQSKGRPPENPLACAFSPHGEPFYTEQSYFAPRMGQLRDLCLLMRQSPSAVPENFDCASVLDPAPFSRLRLPATREELLQGLGWWAEACQIASCFHSRNDPLAFCKALDAAAACSGAPFFAQPAILWQAAKAFGAHPAAFDRRGGFLRRILEARCIAPAPGAFIELLDAIALDFPGDLCAALLRDAPPTPFESPRGLAAIAAARADQIALQDAAAPGKSRPKAAL